MTKPQHKQIESIVDQQLAAYNNRDITAFAATYHDNIEIYDYPDQLRYAGKATLIERYGAMFNRVKQLKASSLQRIISDDKLVDYELAQSSSQATGAYEREVKVLAIYQIEDGLIRRVVFG